MSLKFFPLGQSPLALVCVRSGLAHPWMGGGGPSCSLRQGPPAPAASSPSRLTNEEVGIGCRGAILLLQELVEECGEASNDRGEGALGQDHQHEEWVHQQPQEDAGKACKQTAVRGQALMAVITGVPWD